MSRCFFAKSIAGCFVILSFVLETISYDKVSNRSLLLQLETTRGLKSKVGQNKKMCHQKGLKKSCFLCFMTLVCFGEGKSFQKTTY